MKTDTQTENCNSVPISQQLQELFNNFYDVKYDCTKCNIQDIELIDEGYPISGNDYICPNCKRRDYDLYEDNLGIVRRKVRIDKYDEIIQQVKELENDRISLQQQLSEINRNYEYWDLSRGSYILNQKYRDELKEFLFKGKSDGLIDLNNTLKLIAEADAENSVKLEEFKESYRRNWNAGNPLSPTEFNELADKYFGGKE